MTTTIRSDASGTYGALQVNNTDVLRFGSDNSGSLAGFRNKIHNGGLIVWQRGVTPITVPGASTYLADRFFSSSSTGGTLTMSQSTLPNGKSGLRLTATVANTSITGTNFCHGIAQALESIDTWNLNNTTITVSFWFNASVAGTYSVVLRNGTTTASYAVSFSYAVGGTPQYVTATIAITGGASWKTSRDNSIGCYLIIGALNTGTYQAGSTDTWLANNYLSGPGNTNWGGSNGNYIEVAEVQLEVGSIATPFEHRPYAPELAICQRYLESATYNWTFYSTTGNGGNTSAKFLVAKRTAPTITLSGQTISNLTGAGITSDTISIYCSGVVTATGVGVNAGIYVASAEF